MYNLVIAIILKFQFKTVKKNRQPLSVYMYIPFNRPPLSVYMYISYNRPPLSVYIYISYNRPSLFTVVFLHGRVIVDTNALKLLRPPLPAQLTSARAEKKVTVTQ